MMTNFPSWNLDHLNLALVLQLYTYIEGVATDMGGGEGHGKCCFKSPGTSEALRMK